MTVVGCIIVTLYTLCLLKSILSKDLFRFKYKMFLTMIGFSTFVNIGYTVFYLSYNTLLEYLYILACILCVLGTRNYKISKKYFLASIVLVAVICLGDFQLFFGNMPNVIPFSVSMDSVYHAENAASKAVFSESNIQYLRSIVLFIVILGFSQEYFENEDARRKTIADIKRIFIFMFVLWTIEWAYNNFISSEDLRKIVYFLFGNSNVRKTYAVGYRFLGYSFNGLFTEPSYITVMFIYYAIVWKLGLKSVRDYIFFAWSILLLILNGSTSGMMLIMMAVILLIKNIGFEARKRVFICLLGTVLVLGIATVLNYNRIRPIIETVSTYVQAYLTGGSFTSVRETSAAIRNYGNSVAYAAFKAKLLLGVGFGTTRGYGILPGTLACLGVIGTFAYAFFIKAAFKLKLNLDSVILLCLFIGYSTTILSVWYLYYPALIPFFISLACAKQKG